MKYLYVATVVALTGVVGGLALVSNQSVTPGAPPPAAAEAPQPLVEPTAIDAALKGMVDSQKIVGVSALVYERGQEAYFGAFGLADRENNKPMTRETVVQIFSMTKPVTGVALMKL